jgi:hypothetical protein
MSIQVFLTSDDSNSNNVNVKTAEGESILATLGPEEEPFAIKFNEFFEAINNEIVSNVQNESQLTIELTGSMSLKAKGGVQYLFFNAGAELGSVGTMKITLKSNIKPTS